MAGEYFPHVRNHVLQIDLSSDFLTGDYANLSICSRSNILAICYIVVAVLHLFCLVSQERCDFIAFSLQLLLRIAGLDTYKSMPRDTRTIINVLRLSPISRAYVSCPRCCKLYAVPEGGIGEEVPEKCNFKLGESSPCGRSLRKIRVLKGVQTMLYSRLFLYQDFKHWFARFICRLGMEELLDRDVFAGGSPENQRDIWDGSVLRNFKGADGMPFVRREGGGRYVFMFSWDGLNPLGNREGGKKVSVGAIYMICLNLPAHLRYNRENVYLVGLIPGPNEPSREQLNNFIAPVIDDFVEFWSPGYYVESTPCHPKGRTVQGAIVPVVSDVLALKQVAGLSTHSSNNFCSFCWLQLEDIDDVHPENWIKRDPLEHRRLANLWLCAQSDDDREVLFDQHGIRHSELLRLPYWNPVDFLTIDSMHAFLLGNFKRQCRNTWGFDIAFADDDGSVKAADYGNLPSKELMERGEHILRTSTQKRLFDLNLPVLRHLCLKYDCIPVERYWKKKKKTGPRPVLNGKSSEDRKLGVFLEYTLTFLLSGLVKDGSHRLGYLSLLNK